MATTTPNNGWAVPTSTDYVKDGATAIETLGDAIDTSVGTGLLAWTNWTPTITPQSGTLTSTTINNARYVQLGKIVSIQLDFTITNNGTAAGSIFFSLPAGRTARNSNQCGAGREVANTGNMLQVAIDGTANGRILTFNNSYPGGTGNRLVQSITYEMA